MDPELDDNQYIYRGTAVDIDTVEKLRQDPSAQDEKHNIIIPNRKYTLKRKLVKKYIKDTPYQKMYEESPANNVGSGNIAGANNDPPVKINNKIIKRKKLNDQNI